MITLGLAFFAALVVSLVATPAVRLLANKWGVVDRPDGVRKLHGRHVALGGGLAVLFAFTASTAAVALTTVDGTHWGQTLWRSQALLPALFASASVLTIVGLLDDAIELRGRQKLAGQILAVGLLTMSGLVIREVHVFELHIVLGLLAVPFTLFWLLGAINALNLIDGVDGLATSVGIILSLAVAVMSVLNGHIVEALLATSFAGALVGFLVFNAPPASIFLGDAGSMLIGLIIGVLAIRSSLKGPATVALAAPLAVWAIPILDVAMAILRRKLTGRSIYTTDHGHLHHCLKRRGNSGPRTVLWIGLLCSITACGAMSSVMYNNEFLAVGTVAAVAGTLVASRVFGHSEFVLLYRRAQSTLLSLLSRRHRERQLESETVTRFEGQQQWEAAWEQLMALAQRHGCHDVQLNLQAPFLHEEFHARWRQRDHQPEDASWHAEFPLVSHQQSVGRLSLRGDRSSGSNVDLLHCLANELSPIEQSLQTMLAAARDQHELQLAPERGARHSNLTRSPVAAAASHPLPGAVGGEPAPR